jgi:lysophospholipase L1-like esterase
MSMLLQRRVLAAALAVVALSGSAAWLLVRGDGTAARPVYLALGASDAVGIGADRPEAEGWVPVVHRGLPNGTRLVNLGISGATLDEVLALEAPVVADARPSLVTLWPGPNDLRFGVDGAAFGAQLDQLLRSVRAAGEPAVFVLNLPDLRYVPAFAATDPDALDQVVRDWNARIADAAARHAAHVVDLHGASLELHEHPEYVSPDGFHPSTEGYRRIGELVLAAIDASAAATR